MSVLGAVLPLLWLLDQAALQALAQLPEGVAERMPKPEPPMDAESSGEYWWEGDPTPWGMITASAVFSN